MHPIDRPREKLLRTGEESLSDKELLTAVLGSGTKAKNVVTLSEDVLELFNIHGEKFSHCHLKSLKGLGAAKIAQLLAAQEFFRRRIHPQTCKILSPEHLLPHLQSRITKSQEHFLCATLNGAHELINLRTITIGLVNQVSIHPREVFAEALTDRASAIIIAHNHPSNCLEPSDADIKITQRLKDAGTLLGIHVLDHIIFNMRSYYSFSENNWCVKN